MTETVHGVARVQSSPVAEGYKLARFTRFAWWVLAYTLLVILFGAVVRITGSGAGCGQHWPTCNGEIAHLPKTAKTAIEALHRLTSALSMLAVVTLVVLSFRRFAKQHVVRKAASWSLVFMIIEALIGALLVRLRLVENNDSILRALVMSLHLVNTSLLTAALATTAWTSEHPPHGRFQARATTTWLAGLALAGVLLVSVMGAVTALGDTLYPVGRAALHSAEPASAGRRLLEELRAVHPIVAVIVSVYLWFLVSHLRKRYPAHWVQRWSELLLGLTLVQIAAGLFNIWLSAPGWLQVAHLAIASLLWICLVLLVLSPHTEDKSSPAGVPRGTDATEQRDHAPN